MTTKRRKFSDDERKSILEKAGRQGISAVLHEYQLSYSVFSRWRNKFMRGFGNNMNSQSDQQARSQIKQLLEENTRLKKIIAQQALDMERKEEELKKYFQQYGKR